MALTDNIVAYYKLDESSGNAADSVGSRNMTNNNTTPFVAGKINNGADLESGSSQNFTYTTDSYGIATTGDRSMQAWIKLESNPTSGNTYTIFIHGESLANFRVDIYNNSGTMELRSVRNNAGFNNTSSYSIDLNDGLYHHIAQTVSYSGGTFTIKVYIDGVERISHTSNFSTNTNSITGFKLGTLSLADGAPYYFDGIIDEAGIWSRALSSGEVTTLYSGGNGTQYPFTTVTMTASSGSFTTTFVSANFSVGVVMIASVGSIVSTFNNATFILTGTSWSNPVTKNSSTWSNSVSKNTSLWSNQIKY